MNVADRIGLSAIATPTLTLTEDVAAYAAAGLAGIGIWLHKLERDRIDEFWVPAQHIPDALVARAVDAVASAGLRVSHLVMAGYFTGPGRRDDAIEHALHAMNIAAAFAADCLIVAPGWRYGRSRDETQAFVAQALTDVLERTTQGHVRLALEPVVPWQRDYMNTLGEALDLVEVVDHPNLGVYPDTYHLWRTGSLLDDIERAAGRIFGVHLNDWDPGDEESRPLPGHGVIPLVEVVRAIEATGYSGMYDNEFCYPRSLIAAEPESYGPNVVPSRCASAMRELLEEALVAA